MDNKENRVQISFRVEDSLKAKLELKLAQERRDQTDLLSQMVRDYVDGPASPPAFSKRDDKWHGMLEDILTSGDKEAIDAIQYNLRVFHRVKNFQPALKVKAKR